MNEPCGEQANIHPRFDSTGARGLASREVCNAFVIWMCASWGCRQTLPPNVFESVRYRGPRTLPTQIPNLQTDVRSSSVVRVWVLHRSRNSFAIQSRDDFDFVSCLRVTLKHMRRDRHELHITSLEAYKVLYVAAAIKFW